MSLSESYRKKFEMVKNDTYSMNLIKNVSDNVLPLEEASYMIRDHFKGKLNTLDANGIVLTISYSCKRLTPSVIRLEAQIGDSTCGIDEHTREPQ